MNMNIRWSHLFVTVFSAVLLGACAMDTSDSDAEGEDVGTQQAAYAVCYEDDNTGKVMACSGSTKQGAQAGCEDTRGAAGDCQTDGSVWMCECKDKGELLIF
jgi:hypothetical protein